MNLWFWPFLAASPGLGWSQSASLAENIQGYLAYYLATSVVWDVTRAIGNLIIFTVMTRPIIKILDRFIQRFSFEYQEMIQR
jgi:energy-coupling factor transport system substrate-specific component